VEQHRDDVVRAEPAPTEGEVEERVTVSTPPQVETARREAWWRPAVEQQVVSTTGHGDRRYVGDPFVVQFSRLMWYVLGLVEGLLAIRFVLALLAANPNNAFAAAMYAITGPLVAPFRTLFATPAFGGSVFELYTLIAMVVYLLLWWAIVRLVEIVTVRPVA
jgi:uncharacterized protein YggT (Ycf19 family)